MSRLLHVLTVLNEDLNALCFLEKKRTVRDHQVISETCNTNNFNSRISKLPWDEISKANNFHSSTTIGIENGNKPILEQDLKVLHQQTSPEICELNITHLIMLLVVEFVHSDLARVLLLSTNYSFSDGLVHPQGKVTVRMYLSICGSTRKPILSRKKKNVFIENGCQSLSAQVTNG